MSTPKMKYFFEALRTGSQGTGSAQDGRITAFIPYMRAIDFLPSFCNNGYQTEEIRKER